MFLRRIKRTFITCIGAAKHKIEFTSSQKQTPLKLIYKKDQDKRFIKSWLLISLMNIDYKLVSKALVVHLKKVLSSLITHLQTTYVQNRCISETGRLISDILEITDTINLTGYLVTIDIENVFDTLNHSFLMAVLKKWFWY